MGCGASSSNHAVASPDALSPPQPVKEHDPPHQDTANTFVNVRPQLSVMCRDQFNSKYTNELMYRWRPAEIVQVEGKGNDRVLVHYTGWADTFDHWVDLRTELTKIAPTGLLSLEQCKKGLPLTEEQYQLTMDYFRLGRDIELPAVVSEDKSTLTTDAAPVESATGPLSVIPSASSDPDAEFVIPTKKLPDPPRLPTAPTPVKGTRRTPSSAAVDGSAGNVVSPPRMQPPPLPPLSPPVGPSGPPSVGLPRPPSSAPRRRSGPPAGPPPASATATAKTEQTTGSDNPYAVSDMLDVLDIFYKKGATMPSQKWRPAEIVAIDGDYITIHYLNWDPKYDERLHHLNDNHRLSSFGSKTTRQSMSSNASTGAHSASSASVGERMSAHSRSVSADAPGPQAPPILTLAVAALNGTSEATELDNDAQRRLSLRTPTHASAAAGNDKQGGIETTTPSSARAVDPNTGLTAEQSRFTRNFLIYRKKKQAEKDKENASPPGENSVNTAETPRASEGSNGGFLKQFTNLFGARDAGAAVTTAAGATANHVTAVPNENSAGGANGVANGADTAGAVAQPAEGEGEERDEEEIARREQEFLEKLESKGLHVFAIEGDGNCLFRAVSHQLYLHQDMHEELRACCVEHLTRHRKRFEVFCEGDFDEYLKNMSKPGVWGDDLEIRALEEITDRLIVIYSSNAENVLEPINNSFEEKNLLKGVPPLTLSYHGNSHYNSIYDERYPLPLVHRKSRLLLRSRMALNKQDAAGGNAGSGGSSNGDTAPSTVYSEHGTANGARVADWRTSSHHHQQQQQQQLQYAAGGYGGRSDYPYRGNAGGAYSNGTPQRDASVEDAQQYHMGSYYPTAYDAYGDESNSGVHYSVAQQQQQQQLAAYGEYGYDYGAQQQRAIASSYSGSKHGVYAVGSTSGDHDTDVLGNGSSNISSGAAGYDPYGVQHRQAYAYGGGYHHHHHSHQQPSAVDYTRRGY